MKRFAGQYTHAGERMHREGGSGSNPIRRSPSPKIIAMHRTMLAVFGGMVLLIGSHCPVVQAQGISVTLISTFDSPAGSSLNTGKINDSGTLTATLNHHSTLLGCRVNANGQFSTPFSEPDDIGYTTAEGINAGGEVCGTYADGIALHGYFRRGSSFKSYDVPVNGVTATDLKGLNDFHNFVGFYFTFNDSFAYASIDGNFITIPISGIGTEATGINNLNDVVGTYGDENHANMFHGFMRASDGTLTFPIDFPGTRLLQTVPLAINDAGFIVGFWTDGRVAHGFVIHLPDTFLSYDVPGGIGTSFTGINNSGLIVGTYTDEQHIPHGFLAQLNQ
jgi:hypothetical protein